MASSDSIVVSVKSTLSKGTPNNTKVKDTIKIKVCNSRLCIDPIQDDIFMAFSSKFCIYVILTYSSTV